MTKHELSIILQDMVNKGIKNKNKYVQYHLFGIIYANELKIVNATIEEIVEDAGIPISISSEIRKGIKLSQFVKLNN